MAVGFLTQAGRENPPGEDSIGAARRTEREQGAGDLDTNPPIVIVDEDVENR